MVGRTTERTSTRSRLAGALGSALIVASFIAPVTPALADPVSPLTVTKTANPNPVVSGAQLTYTIAVQNTGGAKVTNVVLTDQVNGVGVIQNPPALPQLIITTSKGSCTQGGANGNVVTCQIGSMNGLESFTVTIRGQVTASSGTTLNNTASVTGTKSAQNFTTTGSVSVLVQGGTGGGPLPDLTINKTGPTSVAPNGAITYTLTVNNVGTANTSDVRVVDTVPAGVTGITATGSNLFVCGISGQTVACNGGSVAAGQNATITIKGTAPASGTLTNTASVDPNNSIVESNELNNTSAQVNTSISGPPPQPLLSIIKTDGNPAPDGNWWGPGGANPAGPDPVLPGQVITYKILVTNNATGTNSRADDVVTVDGTQGLDAASITASQVVTNGTIGNTGGCTVSAPQVRCSLRSLNSGGTQLITIKGTVLQSAGSSIFNTATVTGNVKNTGVSNTDSEVTTVRPAVDLTITKADSPDPVCARSWPTDTQHLSDTPNPPGNPPASGSPTKLLNDPAPAPCLGGLRYDLTIGNSGLATGDNVAVRDWVPAGLIFDSYHSDAGFACGLSGGIIDCTGGTIPAESLRHLSFVFVAPNALGQITNQAKVDPDNAIFEPDETNNDATATTTVTTGVDLVVWKGDSKDADPPGDGAPTLVPGTDTNLGDGYDPIATRGTETYTIYVDNVGPQDVSGIRVRDVLPAGTTFLSVIADPTHGFTCSQDGSASGGVVECLGGHLLGTESEFYNMAGSAPGAPGDDFATIKIRVFARPTVGTMHNEVRVDPLNEIPEINEQNNLDVEDTTVVSGNADQGAFQQLKVTKTQTSPDNATDTVATNGILIYDLLVENLGTDPVSNVVVTDTLPAGTRFIEVKDTGTGSAAFSCSHNGAAFGGVITCTGGDLNGSITKMDGTPNTAYPGPTDGIRRHISIKVFAPNTPATYTNQADVDPANIVPEGNEFDNNSSLDTIVAPCVGASDCTSENAFYELTITKEQNRPTIARNGLETYTLTIANLGSDPVSNIVVQDALPAGVRFLDAKDTAPPSDPAAFTCGSPDAAGNLFCTGGDLSGTVNPLAGIPASRQITIRVFMPDTPATYTNRVTVDPFNAVPEGNEFNDTASVDTVVTNGGPNPYIDLQVDKTQTAVLDQDGTNPIRVDTGQGILYKLHVTNDGEGDAFNVTVRDIVPSGTTFFSAADAANTAGQFTCTFSSPNIDCTGGTIPAGGSRDINIFLIAPTGLDKIASDPGAIKQTITNQAFVDPFNTIAEGDESNNHDSIQTLVESQVNLKIDKKGPSGASQNETTDYKITVTNEKKWGDGRTVFGVKVVDPLPVGLIPIGSVEAGGNFTCQISENPINTVICTGDLIADQSVDITVHVFITADGGTLDNEACVDPDHLIDETSELDNCKTAITGVTPSVADLAVNKSADKSTVTAGDTLNYTVAVINQGTANATGTVTMNDPLPPQVTFVSTNPDAGWTCTGTSTVNCTRTGLNASSTSNIKIVATVNPGATGPFTNVATVTGNNETETGSVITSVGGSPIDLVLSGLSDDNDPANVGQDIKYTFAVSNGGSSPSGSFDITAKMDSGALNGLSFIGAAASQGFTCGAIVTDTVTCTGSLAAGQSTNVTIEFQALASSPTSHTLAVKVDPTDAIAESTDANNDDTETTSVTASLCTSSPCVDLVAGGILVTPDPIVAGGSITRIATVSNAGDTTTASGGGSGNAEVMVFLDPDKETLDSFSATAGFTCSDQSILGFLIIVDCVGDLGPGQGVAITVNSTASGASDGDVLFATVSADPLDILPEGSGADHEFTNSNNDVTVATNVVGP